MTQLDPTSPVNVLADRFWEAILAEEPTTATMYGDERYADRLEDPSPAGRARRRALYETTRAEAAAIDPSEQAARGSDHPRHAPGRRASSGSSPGRPAHGSLPGGRPDGRPADAAAPGRAVPGRRHARAPGALRGAPARLRGLHGRQPRAPAGGDRDGPHGAPDRGRADDRPARAAARDPRCRVDHHDRAAGRRRGRSQADRAARPRRGLSRPTGRSSRRSAGEYLAASRRGAGPVVRPERRRPVPDPDPRLDDARHRSRGRSTGSASRSSSRSRRSDARSRAPHGFGDDTAAYRAALGGGPGEHAGERQGRAARPALAEDIDRAMAARPALLRPAAAGGLRGARRRGVQGEGRPVRLLLSRPRPTARAPGSTTPTATTCRVASTTEARHDDVPRGGPGPPLPDRAGDGEPETSTRSAGSARGWSAARTSRAGASTASGWPTRWASSGTRRSGSGCSTRRPGGRPGSSSTPACTRCAGRASARSTSSCRPACPRRTRSSRPTATSAGPARR